MKQRGSCLVVAAKQACLFSQSMEHSAFTQWRFCGRQVLLRIPKELHFSRRRTVGYPANHDLLQV